MLVLDKQKKHEVKVEAGVECLRQLLVWIKDNLITERPELFLAGDTVRPGILVLVNEADWELCGELDYKLEDQDNLTFISTLHGG